MGGVTTPSVGGGLTWSPDKVPTGWGGQASGGLSIPGTPASVNGNLDFDNHGIVAKEVGVAGGWSKFPIGGASLMGGYTWDLGVKAPFGIKSALPLRMSTYRPADPERQSRRERHRRRRLLVCLPGV